jgi:signal transduction histidine kinase
VLGVSLLAATFLTFVLTRPILELVEAARAVGQGDFSRRVRRWAKDEIGDLAEAFNQMAVELGRVDEVRRERELLRRQLLERVIAAQEEERRRIARELHDSTSQSLTSLMVGLRTLDSACDDPQVHCQTQELRQVAGHVLEDVHNLAVQLRPAVLDDLGLSAALERLVHEWQKRHRIQADVVVHLGSERLPDPIETALYRIVQEALTNVARHARARLISVLVERRQKEIVAVIEDDGQGFDLQRVHRDGHLGLLGIRERAELLGGSLTIESSPGQGASLFIRLPLAHLQIAEIEKGLMP